MGTLPSMVSSGGGQASSGQLDREACIPEDEIYKLSPILQELYSDPGWEGPITSESAASPQRQVQDANVFAGDNTFSTKALEPAEPAAESMGTEGPPPPDFDLERMLAFCEEAERLGPGGGADVTGES